MKAFCSHILLCLFCVGCSTHHFLVVNPRIWPPDHPAMATLLMEKSYFPIRNSQEKLNRLVHDAVMAVAAKRCPLQSVVSLEAIDDTFKRDGFAVKVDSDLVLFSESLNSGQLDCSDRVFVYLEVASKLGMNLDIVFAPRHIFLGMQCDDGRYIFWETITGCTNSYEHYVQTMDVAPRSIERGVYLIPRPRSLAINTAYIEVANRLNRLGRCRDAGILLSQVTRSGEYDILAEYALGATYFRQGKYSQARKLLSHALASDPGFELNLRILCGDISSWKIPTQ